MWHDDNRPCVCIFLPPRPHSLTGINSSVLPEVLEQHLLRRLTNILARFALSTFYSHIRHCSKRYIYRDRVPISAYKAVGYAEIEGT